MVTISKSTSVQHQRTKLRIFVFDCIINPPVGAFSVEPTFREIAPFRPRPAGTRVPRPRPGTHRAAATPPVAHRDARCPDAPPATRALPFCGPFRRVSDLSPSLHCSKARGYFPGTMCLGSLDRGPNLTSRGIRAPTLEFRACGTVAVWVPKCPLRIDLDLSGLYHILGTMTQ